MKLATFVHDKEWKLLYVNIRTTRKVHQERDPNTLKKSVYSGLVKNRLINYQLPPKDVHRPQNRKKSREKETRRDVRGPWNRKRLWTDRTRKRSWFFRLFGHKREGHDTGPLKKVRHLTPLKSWVGERRIESLVTGNNWLQVTELTTTEYKTDQKSKKFTL